ncbi:MAG: TGS domain-containing protein [Bacteroidales bacterium]|nr:TGS domain-containing protein [Bacteroidales bacterium]
MAERYFTEEEHGRFVAQSSKLFRLLYSSLLPGDYRKVKRILIDGVERGCFNRDSNGINGLIRNIDTAVIMAEMIGLRRIPVIALLLYRPVHKGIITLENVESMFGSEVLSLLKGLMTTTLIYSKKQSVDTAHFDKLMLALAEDIRVVLIMIADRLCMLRMAKFFIGEDERMRIAVEAAYLHIPLAHKMGLYPIKSEMEDLYLKYTNREMFDFIVNKLHATKAARDRYIAQFIAPINERLKAAGFNYSIKGRTKSIYSIWNKLNKQQIEFEGIYDLFAIRIILDTPLEKEKSECWQVYSIITDMYQPNPKRLKDWLSIPKSNGYESLHTTVLGPESRWVEVQIRTKRMDEIAEKGLAAHWRYKGVKGDNSITNALNNVREALETGGGSAMDLLNDFKMDLYEDEIFVFTPSGDLYRLPKGSTVLDFAFAIHSNLGVKCISAKLDGKNVPIKHVLKSGDQVEIITSPNQVPSRDWLAFVKTQKARVKIKQSLKEAAAKEAEYAKELLQRRFKNRKIEVDESILMRLIKKKGYKTVTDFYADMANERLDVNHVIDLYLEMEKKENASLDSSDIRSAGEYITDLNVEDITSSKDVLLIDRDLKGIEYKLAKCCNPIFGDEVFGYVSTQGIKIHRVDCPNAPEIYSRFGYRIVKAKWSGKSESGYEITLRLIGNDDIGIVSNVTSVISKENNVRLRSISVDSKDGLFQGNVTVVVTNTSVLEQLIKKIAAVKGIKQVSRLNH